MDWPVRRWVFGSWLDTTICYYSMTKEQNIILTLIRKAIDPSFFWFIEEQVDWKTAIGFSLKQGVAGITFDSYQ